MPLSVWQGVSNNGVVSAPAVFYPFFINITLELLLGTRFPPRLHAELHRFAMSTLLFQSAVDPTTGMINMTPWVRHFAPNASGYADCLQSNKEIKEFIGVGIVSMYESQIPLTHSLIVLN